MSCGLYQLEVRNFSWVNTSFPWHCVQQSINMSVESQNSGEQRVDLFSVLKVKLMFELETVGQVSYGWLTDLYILVFYSNVLQWARDSRGHWV